MIEAKQEPLPHSAFDYSHYIRDPAGMITERKRKDGAWICVCATTPKLWIDDVGFSNSLMIEHNGSVHSFLHICFEGVVSEPGEVERVSRERRRGEAPERPPSLPWWLQDHVWVPHKLDKTKCPFSPFIRGVPRCAVAPNPHIG